MNDAAPGLGLDAFTADWAAVKLVPLQTGLPLAVWITENEGYPHDVRVKVDGSWAALGVRPSGHEIVPGSLPAADVALVRRWIDLNRDAIVAFWDGVINAAEVLAMLRVL